MNTVVRFRVARSEYAVPVERAHEVRPAGELLPMASAREGIAGLLRWSGETLSVVSLLGEGGGHVLVLDCGGDPFGLLVDEVTGVTPLGGPVTARPPGGQRVPLLSGTASAPDGALLLLVDVAALDHWLRE